MHSPDGIVHFDSSTVSDFKKEYAIWTPYPLAKSKTGPYRPPPVTSSPKATGLFVRRIRFRHQQPDDPDRAQCYPSNADKSNRATKISDDKAEECGAERRADAGEGPNEALG
jgi:hypothetical protein